MEVLERARTMNPTLCAALKAFPLELRLPAAWPAALSAVPFNAQFKWLSLKALIKAHILSD